MDAARVTIERAERDGPPLRGADAQPPTPATPKTTATPTTTATSKPTPTPSGSAEGAVRWSADPHHLPDAGALVEAGHPRTHHARAQPAPRAGLLIVRVAR